MGHQLAAHLYRRTQAIDHVNRRHWPDWGHVDLLLQVPDGEHSANHLQVWDGDFQLPAPAEHAVQLTQRDRNLMRMHVLQHVVHPDDVHGLAVDGGEVGDVRDNVGLDVGVEVDADLLPFGASVARVHASAFGVWDAATGVENDRH